MPAPHSAFKSRRVIRYIIRRLIWAVVLFFAVTAITYAIFYVIPLDPARKIAGKSATEQDVQRVREQLHLDDPLYQQYGRFVKDIITQGSLGYSYSNRIEVTDTIRDAAPITAALVFGGMIFWLLVSIPIGVYSALHPRSRWDRAAMLLVLIGISAHPVWIGLLLSYFLGYKLDDWTGTDIFPIQGYCDAFSPPPGASCGGYYDWFSHLILPWSAIMVLYAAFYVRMIRATTMETLNEDFVRTARAKGASERRVLVRHVMRNSMLPVVTILGMDLALALGGAVFIEIVFGLPGLGKEAVSSVYAFDYPVTMGLTVFATLVIILFNLIVDILYAFIDPRIRLA